MFGLNFQLSAYDVQDVRGDGGCYYRCLSLYFTGSEESYNKYRYNIEKTLGSVLAIL